jgi:hypothetical protein
MGLNYFKKNSTTEIFGVEPEIPSSIKGISASKLELDPPLSLA